MGEVLYVQIVQPGSDIDLTLWKKVVMNDPDLEPVNHLSGRNPITMEEMKVIAPHSARWVGHPERIPFFFRFEAGSLVVGSADAHGVAKAESIARQIGAVVEATVD